MKSNIMKWLRAVCAIALIGILLLSGCTASPDQQEGINPTEPTQSTQAPVSTEIPCPQNRNRQLLPPNRMRI